MLDFMRMWLGVKGSRLVGSLKVTWRDLTVLIKIFHM
jgi:hypothetical protein